MQQTYMLLMNGSKVLGSPFEDYEMAEKTAKDFIKSHPDAEIIIVSPLANIRMAENPYHIRRYA